MSEAITSMRIDDAIAGTDAFLARERGASLDGAFAGQQIANRVVSVQARAEALLTSVPHPKMAGWYVPLSQYNAARFSEAVAVLPGHLVLVPSVLVRSGPSAFYPAVVSEDSLKTNSLRLHVLLQPYRRQVSYGSSVLLSAAGQSETAGIGEHGRKATEGIEAEHFATLLATADDPRLQTAWQSGQHVNHGWRQQTNNSVSTEISKRLFDREVRQATIAISQSQIRQRQAMLFWHEGLRNQTTGRPETAVRNNALVVMQALGFQALQTRSPQAVNTVKRLMA